MSDIRYWRVFKLTSIIFTACFVVAILFIVAPGANAQNHPPVISSEPTLVVTTDQNYSYTIKATITDGTPSTETSCSDGIDNDGDSLVDCSDPDCDADSYCNVDADYDDLPDWWEAQYAGTDLSLLNGRNGDADNDGISNWIEYKLGSNPLEVDLPGPGIFYSYDALGRITKIQRLPSQ